jgi:hypothetical protein
MSVEVINLSTGEPGMFISNSGMAKNRYLSAAATTWAAATNSCTWNPDGVNEITIAIPTTASLTNVLVVFDAPNDVVAANWFTSGISTSNSTDLQTFVILPNSSKTFQLSSKINRIDFLPIGAACPVFVEAA